MTPLIRSSSQDRGRPPAPSSARNRPRSAAPADVVEWLEAALSAFRRSTSFEDGALLAVNLGDDADTTGAVDGQLAGAFYREHGIPESWCAKLSYHDLIERFAERLLDLSQSRP